MEPKDQSLLIMVAVLVLGLAGCASSDISQDKSECTEQLIGLSGCLGYVGGTAKAPSIDCCSGLKQVLGKSMKCLCVLIKDKDDPSLGLKINATLAATLPTTCHAPVNMSNCIGLLHLAPNSTEAKMFQGYEKLTQEMENAAPASSGNSSVSAKDRSDGGKRKSVEEMLFGVCVAIVITCHLLLLYDSN